MVLDRIQNTIPIFGVLTKSNHRSNTMKRILLCLITLLSFLFNALAQDNHSLFREYLNEGDTLKQLELLNKWQEESPNDAELYTSWFNYYFVKSRNEIIVMNSGTPTDDGESFILRDSTDQIAGFISSRIDYDQSNLKRAFESIEKGIESYPNRLDMRFGKIYALGTIKNWESFTNEIIKTIDYSVTNNNEWTWTKNVKYEGGKEGFLSSLQNYQSQLYETMDDALLINIQDISRAILKYYPDHVESLSNLSIAYLVERNFEKALEPLLEAEKISPKDFIILNNIAYAYKELGDKENAIVYYEKVLEFGDQQAKLQAEKELSKLREQAYSSRNAESTRSSVQ